MATITKSDLAQRLASHYREGCFEAKDAQRAKTNPVLDEEPVNLAEEWVRAGGALARIGPRILLGRKLARGFIVAMAAKPTDRCPRNAYIPLCYVDELGARTYFFSTTMPTPK